MAAQNEWHPSPYIHRRRLRSHEYDFATAKGVTSSGLSVPALGGETSDAMPTRVLLAPRSRRQIENTPSRPPRCHASDFAPPPPSPRMSREAIQVDSEKVQIMHSESKRNDLAHAFRQSQSSPIGEEKKTDDSKPSATDPSHRNQNESFLPLAFSLRARRCSPYSQDNKEELKKTNFPKLEPLETPSTPTQSEFTTEPTEAGNAMSPVRENPKTLMEVPENILTLPISPFGPNDGPG
ncbi:MAG: hypothetical protein SGBAC_004803 [Bacillariaceae sp.]